MPRNILAASLIVLFASLLIAFAISGWVVQSVIAEALFIGFIRYRGLKGRAWVAASGATRAFKMRAWVQIGSLAVAMLIALPWILGGRPALILTAYIAWLIALPMIVRQRWMRWSLYEIDPEYAYLAPYQRWRKRRGQATRGEASEPSNED